MRSARLSLALETGALTLPETGLIAVYRPHAGDDLSALPRDRVVVLTGFKPDHDHFAARYAVTARPALCRCHRLPAPRRGEAARALIAQAAAEVGPGGWMAVDGQKTDGIDTALKDLRARVDLSESLSKAHGKLATFHRRAGSVGLGGAKPAEVGAGSRPCRASSRRMGRTGGRCCWRRRCLRSWRARSPIWGRAGAIWRAEILKRPGVKRLDLVEAEADALACAQVNVADDRARFHWADATTFRPETLLDAVVMNPPFHTGRSADPALGRRFHPRGPADACPGRQPLVGGEPPPAL